MMLEYFVLGIYLGVSLGVFLGLVRDFRPTKKVSTYVALIGCVPMALLWPVWVGEMIVDRR